MGGGFYDRTLARTVRAGPRLIGLAHAVQELAEVPRERWDVPLSGVLTERGWIPARAGIRPA